MLNRVLYLCAEEIPLFGFRVDKMFLFSLFVYFPQPWYTYPLKEATVKRFLCKGWMCQESDFPIHQHDEFALLIKHYLNGDYQEGLVKKMDQYIERGFYPAYCAAGFFALAGIAGFKKNETQSFELLQKGISHDLWACYDIMSFHPYLKNTKEHLAISSEKGGVWSMLYKAFSSINRTETLELLLHIANSETSGWWKRRRSGKAFANAVSCILGFNSNLTSTEDAWNVLLEEAKSGNLPAAIWAANGYMTGEIGERNVEKGIKIITPFIRNGPWRVDLNSLLETDNIEDKTPIFNLAAKIGQTAGNALSSYNI